MKSAKIIPQENEVYIANTLENKTFLIISVDHINDHEFFVELVDAQNADDMSEPVYEFDSSGWYEFCNDLELSLKANN